MVTARGGYDEKLSLTSPEVIDNFPSVGVDNKKLALGVSLVGTLQESTLYNLLRFGGVLAILVPSWPLAATGIEPKSCLLE